MRGLSQDSFIPAERQDYIVDLVRKQRTIRVSALSEALRVSEVTVRRDLKRLEEQGILERTHGGAVTMQCMAQEPLYVQKDRLHLEAKQAIGAAVARLVNEGETIFVNSGSTTKQIFRHLADIPRVRVVTSNAAAITELANCGESLELIMVGGAYRWQSNSIVGPFALATIAQMNACKTLIGVDGISTQRGLTTPVQDEAGISRAMIEQTQGPIIVVADHTKFGVIAEFVVSSLRRVETIVTDAGLGDGWRRALEEIGIRVLIAETA